MPVFTLEESNIAGPIPDDEILVAKIMGIKQVTKPYKDDNGNEVQKLEFSFTVDDPTSAFDGNRIWGETGITFVTHPDCKLKAWAQEILGQELHPPFSLDTEDLIGNHCRVVVGLREYEKDGQPKVRNFVKDVIRSKNGSAFGSVDSEEPF